MEGASILDLLLDSEKSTADDPEISPVAFVLLDRTRWTITAANQSFRHFCTRSLPDESDFLELIHPDDRKLLKNHFGSASLHSGPSAQAEVRITCGKEADWHWCLITIAELSDDKDDTASLLLHLVDIERQKKQHDTEASRARRWNYALVSSGLGVWDHNYGTGEKFYSRTWRIMRGLVPDEPLQFFTEEDWLQNVHPQDRDFVRHAIARQRVGDPDYMNFEYRERHADEHWIWIECRGDAVEFFEDGKPSRIVGTDRDVSDRKMSELLLARTRRRLELAVETSQIGVFERNLVTNEVSTDARMAEIYGFEDAKDKVPASRFVARIHPDDLANVMRRAEKLTVDGPAITDRFRIYRENDGELRHVQHRVAMFRADDGVETYIGTNWDITEETRMRQELLTAKQVAEARNFELDRAKSDIERAVHHDYLTGLPNRSFLDEELSRRLDIAKRDETRIALLQFDIYNFRSINATYGHEAGDKLLKHVANTLLNMSRHNDFLARISGDEFVMISNMDSSRKSLLQSAERILLELSKPIQVGGKRLKATASIGIATTQDSDTERAGSILQNAGSALRRAKSEGPNRIALFKPDKGRSGNMAQVNPENLIEAIEKGAFVPHYQPQYDAKTLRLCGLEALARWKKHDGSIIEPAKFIPLADSLNLMNQIDKAIMEKALEDSARWKAQGFDTPRISVNISPRRLSDPALVTSLQKLDITGRALSFELLESIFLDRQDDISAYNLREIRKLGIEIEIDDFGTGYTSITSLLHLAPQALKIAREQVVPLTHSREQHTIIKSIIDIGKALNIRVVAEGVETKEQIELLTSLGCDVLQGFGLGRPVPADQIEKLLTPVEDGQSR